MSIDWLLNDIFTNLDRGYLLEQRTRQQVANYFNTVIEDFKHKNDSDGKDECRQIVQAVLKFHGESKSINSGVCLFGKYHDLLYVAAKLCYTWNLDHDVVSRLMYDIYDCEKTFEKLFECAIFGSKITQLISGWRSDYRDQTENLKVSIYFLEYAARNRLSFLYNDMECSFVDVPMNCYEKLSPLKAAVKSEKWEIVNLLLKYGATGFLPKGHAEYEKYSVFKLFLEKLESNVLRFCYYSPSVVESFAMFMKTVPHVSQVMEVDSDEIWLSLVEFFEDLGLSISEPSSLKHLARCATRVYFSRKQMLPARLNGLMIPISVKRYIDLEEGFNETFPFTEYNQ